MWNVTFCDGTSYYNYAHEFKLFQYILFQFYYFQLYLFNKK